jgi:hypothetical protein
MSGSREKAEGSPHQLHRRLFAAWENAAVRYAVAAFLLVSIGVVIATIIRAVTSRAYRPEEVELNLNLARMLASALIV